jgi:16S rRNA G966 N2-methylase RsmD
MQDIINKRGALRELTDEKFETLLPSLANELETNGILYENYDKKAILTDWKALCKKPLQSHGSGAITNIAATNTAGMKIMKQYMKHFYEVANYKGVSIKSLWKREFLEKALRFNRRNHSTPYASEIIRSLGFTNGLGKVTMYRPLMARNIIHYFQATSVLDVCAGWGGRMLGAKSLGEHILYTGIEPCKKTFTNLCTICNELDLQNIILVNEKAEDFLDTLADSTKFDIALTSPPYFNLEVYSDEPTQSISGEKNYQIWLNTFLEPVIVKVLQRVTYSCWSVKNFKTDKKYDLLLDVVRIHEKHGWKLLDIVFTMSNSKRPGANSSTTPKKTEESTYVFIKQCDDVLIS